MSASCFFRQAVSVDTNNHTLWMEYAEITYILQSYCSKYVKTFDLLSILLFFGFRKKKQLIMFRIDHFY
jgi:hypothetical protein